MDTDESSVSSDVQQNNNQYSFNVSNSTVTDVDVNCLIHEAQLTSANSVEGSMSIHGTIDNSL